MGEVVGLGENIDGVVAVLRVLRNVCKGRFEGPSRAFEQVVEFVSVTANVFFNGFKELIGKARHNRLLFALNDDLPQSVQDESSVLISSHAQVMLLEPIRGPGNGMNKTIEVTVEDPTIHFAIESALNNLDQVVGGFSGE